VQAHAPDSIPAVPRSEPRSDRSGNVDVVVAVARTPAAALPPPATAARRRLATTPAPVPAIAPIHAEPSAAPLAAAASLAQGSSVGVLRHEQAERGAHEGGSGQLHRPTARDGFLGHAFGQGVEVVLFACLHSLGLLSTGAGLVGPTALPTRHSMVGYKGWRNFRELRFYKLR
jgi:hypothetical protein